MLFNTLSAALCALTIFHVDKTYFYLGNLSPTFISQETTSEFQETIFTNTARNDASYL